MLEERSFPACHLHNFKPVDLAMSICPSVTSHVSERLPLNGFSRSFKLGNFQINRRKISDLFKIGQKMAVTLNENLSTFIMSASLRRVL